MASARKFMRCPRCRSTTFLLIEIFEEEQTRTVVDGQASRECNRWPGGLLRTECRCTACEHAWLPRQATLDAAAL